MDRSPRKCRALSSPAIARLRYFVVLGRKRKACLRMNVHSLDPYNPDSTQNTRVFGTKSAMATVEDHVVSLHGPGGAQARVALLGATGTR